MFLVKDFTNFTDKTTTLTVNFCNVVFCMLGRWPLCTLRLKLKLKLNIREAKFNYEKDLARNINNNSKLFCKYVRENSKTKPIIGSFKDEFGSIITEDTEKANLLNKHFASVFKSDDNMEIPTILPKTS